MTTTTLDTGVLAPPTGPLTSAGLQVLLVFGAKIKPARWGRPGIRVTAGHPDSGVLIEAVGFYPAWSGEALVALDEAVRACKDAGLVVQMPHHSRSGYPARVIRRRPQ